MKTIDKILKRNNYTYSFLANMEKKGVCNWCWGKGGFNFSDNFKKMPAFEADKEQKLLKDFRTVCNIHDIKFHFGNGFIDYIKANYEFWLNCIELLHWTSVNQRIIVFSLTFFGTTFFGWKYFKKN